MIYSFQLDTGVQQSGLHLKTNRDSTPSNTFGNQEYFLDSSLVTGSFITRMSANGQTLYEGEVINDTSLGYLTQYGTGDYFTTTGALSKSASLVNLDSTLQDVSPSLLYDIRSGVQMAHSESETITGLEFGITGSIAEHLPDFTGNESELSLFLNGQKLHDGADYSFAGSAISLSGDSTGRIFAIPDKPLEQTTTGSNPFLQGTKFTEGRSSIYVNGVEQHPDSWLECSTGVTMIDPEVRAILLNTPSSGVSFSL